MGLGFKPIGRADGHESLEARCARALYTAARATCIGSRQQVRAAVRAFVRRHRRDRDHLAFALRCARASSALAVALLGIGAEPASARSTSFLERTGSANPFFTLVPGETRVTPVLGDLDRDGDLDLVTADANGDLRYFEHTDAFPVFAERTGAANPLDGHVAPPTGNFPSLLVLADLNADGDLDVVGGRSDGTFFFLENTGSATQPGFSGRSGSANPFDGLDAGTDSEPALGDLDGDGDLDLAAFGSNDAFFENTGGPAAPAFVERTGPDDPLGPIGAGTSLRFGDLDRDGDLDFAGAFLGEFFPFIYYENTGTPTHPVFVQHSSSSNPLEGPVLTAERVALGDLDADGDLDLAAGVHESVRYFENRAGLIVVPPWTGSYRFPSDFADVGSDARPALADLDRDGDLEVLVGAQDGTFSYFEIVSDPKIQSPLLRFQILQRQTGAVDPLNGVDVGSYSAPAFADLDGDGDFDLASGESGGTFWYFENTGTPTNPAFVRRTGEANPLNGIVFSYGHSTAAFGDLDRDGDLDLVAANGVALRRYENTGGSTSPAFISLGELPSYGDMSAAAIGDVDGDGDLDVIGGGGGYSEYLEYVAPHFRLRSSPLESPLDGNYLRAPALADLDRDGDLDVLGGHLDGTLRYFRNAAVQPIAIAVHALAGAPNPFTDPSGGSYETPALGDLDGDGDSDLVAGSTAGDLRFYENTGNAVIPLFAARTGGANPLPVATLGTDAAPALADLDADADLDLVLVTNAGPIGAFHYYENTGTALSAAFVLRTGADDPLAGQNPGRNGTPALGDLDGDGDYDLVAGRYDGTFAYYENTGEATSPHFAFRTPYIPLDGKDVGQRSSPALADLNRDGDLDLVAGRSDGTFAYYENFGTAVSPSFSVLTVNPLGGVDLGQRSAPALGNLDGYGNADLVAGGSGGFRAYLLPEPARNLLFAAGTALVGALTWITQAGNRARTRTGSRARSAR